MFPNGKRYIGITKTYTQRRWGTNGNKYKNQFVYKAIEKYGWESITHYIWAVCESEKNAKRIEKFLIERYKTTDSRYGYNVLPGGDLGDYVDRASLPYKHTNGTAGKTLKEETKQKISKASKKMWACNKELHVLASKRSKKLWENKEFREKRLKCLDECRRRPTSEETKEKIRLAQVGKRTGDDNVCSRSVVALKKDGTYIARYGSIGEAARAVKTSPGNISMCCNHKPGFLSCKGLVWMFEEEYIQNEISRGTDLS